MKITEEIKQLGLQNVIDKYSLTSHNHLEYDELIQLTYHQLNTPKNDCTNETRGLILNKETLEVIAYPFYRFFDYNANVKTNFDFESAKYTKKYDGSIMTLYFYKGKWNVATKQVPDARFIIKDIQKTFAQSFWELFNELGYQTPTENINLIFEMTLPLDAYISKETKDLTLIGARNMNTLKEIDIEQIDGYHKPIFIRKPLNEILEEVDSFDALKQEGYVVVDNDFNRLKIKGTQYKNIQALSPSENNDERLLSIIITNDYHSFLEKPKYAQYAERYFHLKVKFDKFLNDFKAFEDRYKNDFLKNDLHILIKDENTIFKNYAFTNKKEEEISIRNFLKKTNKKSILEFLKNN